MHLNVHLLPFHYILLISYQPVFQWRGKISHCNVVIFFRLHFTLDPYFSPNRSDVDRPSNDQYLDRNLETYNESGTNDLTTSSDPDQLSDPM